MFVQPVKGIINDRVERARLLEQMTSAGHDAQFLFTSQRRQRLFIEQHDVVILAADDQHCGGGDMGQRVPGQIRTPSSRDDAGNTILKLASSLQRGGRTCARTKEPKRQI